jgi:hypothetical protein
LLKLLRKMLGAHMRPVTASAPALGTISSVPLSLATLAMAMATPECTVPTSTSTLSRLTSLLTLSVALAGVALVVDLDELDLAAAELAALLGHIAAESRSRWPCPARRRCRCRAASGPP